MCVDRPRFGGAFFLGAAAAKLSLDLILKKPAANEAVHDKPIEARPGQVSFNLSRLGR
jgi:hypothetical protein